MNGFDTSVNIIVLFFIPPSRCPCKWPKHVGRYPFIKYDTSECCCAFVGTETVFKLSPLFLLANSAYECKIFILVLISQVWFLLCMEVLVVVTPYLEHILVFTVASAKAFVKGLVVFDLL